MGRVLPDRGAPSGEQRSWEMTAFGLSVRSELPLLGPPASNGRSDSHALEIRHLDGDSSEAYPVHEEVTVLERRHPDGSLGMRVSRLEAGGYRIDAPGHGAFAVASDGAVICCAQLREPSWRWHRPLFAQAMPLAATLQGFELLHASAVALDDHAVAFVARSGTGKTSLATQLIARGASPLTDDVLSLESRGAAVIAHPGVRMANIAREQMELLSPAQRARVGRPVGVSDKIHVELASMPTGPLPLAALFFLERSEQIERLTFARSAAPNPREILGSTFMPHIVTPARLTAQLEACAVIATTVPIFQILAPSAITAARLAIAVEREAAKVLG